MSDQVIQPLRLRQLQQFRQLFLDSLETDFQYFSVDYLAQMQRAHSLWRLGVACLRPGRLVILARRNYQPAGYLIAKIAPTEHSYIYWMYVAPKHRGQKLGRALVELGCAHLARHGCTKVNLLTHDQKNFYQAMGFSVDRFYAKLEGNVDMYHMSKALT